MGRKPFRDATITLGVKQHKHGPRRGRSASGHALESGRADLETGHCECVRFGCALQTRAVSCTLDLIWMQSEACGFMHAGFDMEAV